MKNIVNLEELSIDIPINFSIYDSVKKNAKHYHFRKGKEHTCSNCGKVVDDSYPSCPNCYCELEPFQIKSNTNYVRLRKHFWVIALQKTSDRIVERWFIACLEINRFSLVSEVSYEEVERNTIMNGQVSSISKGRYYLNQGEWCYGYKYVDNFNGKTPRKRIEIYPKYSQMESWLSNTELKYTTIGKWFEQQEEPNTKSYATFAKLAFAAKYQWIEKVYKSGLVNLWLDLIQSYQVDFRRAKPSKILKYRKLLIKVNAGWPQFYAIDRFTQIKQSFSLDLIKKINTADQVNNIVKVYQITKMPIQKIMNYINMFDVGGYSIATYIDYLNMMNEVYQADFNELMAFPKDLIKAHDDAVEKFNALTHEKEVEQWKTVKSSIMKYAYQNGKYAIVIPNSIQHVLNEGKALHHCVGSYVPKIVEGKTTILFIREFDNINKPFYTLEYNNNSVIQCRGMRNETAPVEIKEFLIEWENHLKKNVRKMQYSKKQVKFLDEVTVMAY